ncbi:disulfide bond formation protein DsbB [Paraglaciecola sp. L3A3]|uniref:disulfide bond formation protein DsbB n=1 Tax=Paraglaciecola sp. L3A3 TaxID=2686358 RepID=UPI00131A8E99|nr:disulfide bond formation protein DsbB [Paraglaciecola sp. L3A3]
MLLLKNLADNPKAWGGLFLSALVLELAALYFQYGLELLPCIMCIYQRTAVFGIMFSALPAMLINNLFTRIMGFVSWGVSAIWGLFIAIEHVDIQTATNPFFATCEIVPNFPSWAPLHEWLPNIFAATGDCGDINWSLLDMSMPQWMIIVFAIYSAILVVVLSSRMILKRSL